MFAEASLLDLGRRLAQSLATNVVRGLGARIAGSFRDPEVDRALKDALADALVESLPHALPEFEDAGTGDAGMLRQHFENLLTEFLTSEPVVVELTLLLDPRPGVFIDTRRLADGFPYERADFPGLELECFLDRLVEEFYRATVRRPPLQKLIEIKLLGEQVAATKEGVRVQRQVVDELAGVRKTFNDGIQRLIESGDDRLVVENVNVHIQGGWLDAYSAYEALLAAIRGQGYEVEVADGDRLALEAPRYSEQPRLPAAGEATIGRLAGELRRAVLAHSPVEEDLDAIEERYRRRLDAWLGHLEFRGMMRAPRPIRLPLADVYVDLRAVAEVPEAADAFSVDERRLLLELESEGQGPKLYEEKRRDLTDQLDSLRRERWSRTLPDRKPIADALHRADQRALVILGDPGSGKTTLLHFLALIYARSRAAERLGVPAVEADRLPIFVPLAAFDDMRRSQPELTLQDFFALYYDTRRGLPGLAPLFRRALESGRALVLFDGLDEVLDVTTRNFVADQVAAMIGEWTPRGNRFVLASRVVGYREAPVSGQVTTLTVLDFGRPEIEVFVRQWSRAFEVWLAEGESAEALEKAAALERDLMEDVVSNPSVQRLAANPLMLTMLALLRRQVGRLPHRRIELYEKYVETLLENWIEARSFGARTERIERLDRHQAENVLIPLALWLQETRPSNTARRHEMHARLTEIYLEEEVLARETADKRILRRAEDQAERFLREMRSMAGLIIERGHDAYGFLHLTFQEHFAGRALAQLSDEERWQVIRGHLHDPRWHEPILLCAGRLGIVEGRRRQVTAFVRRIWENEDSTEEDLRRNLLLALAIACDDVNLDASLTDAMVEQASALVPSGTPVLDLKLLERLGRLVADGAADLEACFRSHLDSADDRLRRDATDVLGRCLNVEALRALFLERLGHESSKIRRLAVRALARCIDDAEVRAALLKAFNDGVSDVRQEALQTVAPRLEDAEIRNAVLKALKDDYFPVRREALRASAARLEDAEIRNAVLKAFNDDHFPVRREALQTVALWLEDTEFRDAVLKAFKDTDHRVRQKALQAAAPRLEDTEIRSAVLKAFNDSHSYVRQEALRALAPRLEDSQIRSFVTEGLEDPAPQVREAALRLLPERILECSPLQERFFQEDWPLRKSLPGALAEVLTSMEQYELFHSLQDERRSFSANSVAARILSAWVAVTGDRSAGLVYLADQSWEIRQEALRTVAPCLEDTEIRGAVFNTFKDGNYAVRQEALRTAAPCLEDMEIRSVVFNALNDASPNVRQEALRTVAPRLEDAEIRNVVLRAFNDDHRLVRQEAVRTVAPRLEDAEIRNAVLKVFNDSDFSVRREASRAVAPHMDDVEVRCTVLKAFNDSDAFMRQEALRTLAPHLDDTEIRNAVLKAFNDSHFFVRQEAVRTVAASLDVVEVRCAALKAFNDDHFLVRQEAVRTLAPHLEDAQFRNTVLKAFNDSHYAVRQEAVRTVAPHLDDAEFRNAVFKTFNDDHVLVRQEVVRTLAPHLEDAQFRSAVLETFDDSYYGVRQEAVRTVAPHLDDAGIASAVLDTFDDDSFAVRLTCVEVLVASPVYQKLPFHIHSQIGDWISVDTRLDYVLVTREEWPHEIRQAVAKRLAQRLPEDAELRDRMLALLGDVRASSRLGAALTLLAWPGGPPDDVRDRVLAAVDDRRDLDSYPARLEAASYLINRNETSASAVELSLEALDYGTLPWEHLPGSKDVRKQAALVLSKLEPLDDNQRAYDKLLDVLHGDEDPDVRDAAYEALVRLARAREQGATA